MGGLGIGPYTLRNSFDAVAGWLEHSSVSSLPTEGQCQSIH